MLNDSSTLLPVIGKQKQRERIVGARLEDAEQQLAQAIDERDQAIAKAKGNYKALQQRVKDLEETRRQREKIADDRDEVVKQRRHHSAQREAWKRTMVELFNQGKVSMSLEEIQKIKDAHATDAWKQLEEQENK